MKEKKQHLRVLCLEENSQTIRHIENILADTFPELELKTAKNEKEFLKFVNRFRPDIILASPHLEKYSVLEAFEFLQKEQYRIPFIIIADKLSEEAADAFINNGVDECVRDSDLTRLPVSIQKAINKRKINTLIESAENLLQQEQERLGTILKYTPEAIINVGFKGEILEINPTGLSMLQVEGIKKLDKKDIFDFIHPEDLKRFRKFHSSAGIGNKKTERFKIVGQRKEEHWVETSAVPLLDKDHHVVSVLTINRDITEQLKAEEQIRYHARLFENISDAVISLDPYGVIKSWNKGAQLIYGWTAKEAIGKKNSELYLSNLSPENIHEISSKLLQQGQWSSELKALNKDGKDLTIISSSSVLRDVRGNVTGFVVVHRDITERKLAEVALLENQLRLKAGQEIANMGYWERDLIALAGVWSRQMFKIFEYDVSAGSPSFEEFLSLVHPDDKDEVRRVQNNLLETTDKITHRYRLLLKDGRIKYILAFSQLLKNEEGLPYKLMGTTMDVTELVLAKEQVLINEKKFQELFEFSPDAIYVEDENGFILDANKVACNFQGYSKEELVGKNLLDLVPDQFKRDVSYRYESSFNKEEAVVESFAWDKNMHARPVEIKTNRVMYDGKPAVLVHARDISKRREAEKEKRDTEKKFETLTEQAPVAIYQVDNAGNFIHVNKKFTELFELSEEQVIKGEWKNRVHPDDFTMFMKLREETIGSAKRVEIEYKLLIDQRIKYVIVTSVPLFSDEGKQIGRIGTILDLTENKKSLAQMIRTQTMFQNVFEFSPDAILIEDFDGNILNANFKACNLYGLEYDELVGKNIRDIVPDTRHEEVMDNHRQFCEGTLHRVKSSLWDKNGNEIPVEIRADLINYFDTVALLSHMSTVEQ